jgi:hypothetical protein
MFMMIFFFGLRLFHVFDQASFCLSYSEEDQCRSGQTNTAVHEERSRSTYGAILKQIDSYGVIEILVEYYRRKLFGHVRSPKP